ncbi:MAG: monovalent cation/H+ antiporter subunit D family protein [Deltaproteobacteria bacterium]|uniref:Monovalent cation/H+ antiporter subunit D family protein n=1 Tax=Candidatus Desulfacyla euxinica TaxID=2841693 RepID=A0A8J6N0H7_9DELT|nr:monovalent cation/H+ antiporter subunit D family protein [Candidatus Desulfacyla euxinica]
METIISIKPLLAVLVSLLITPVLVSSKTPNVREAWTFAAAFMMFMIVVSMLPAVLKGAEMVYTVAEVLPGVPIKFKVDAFGMLFALVSSSLWIITTAYSIGYMRGLDEHSQTRYFCFFALALSATIGVAFSANLLTLFLFYEMLSFATYPLVTHHQDMHARSSGRKYLLYIVGGSVGLVLPAMLICYNLAGTLEFTSQGFLAGTGSKPLMTILMMMLLFGFAKVAVMPLHSWLPAAMVAPTPVSALLHAVAVVKVGAFSVLRVITGVFGTDLLVSLGLGSVICYIAAFTIVVASLIALSQDELKRRLAFSTIGQLSYIVLGAALLSPKGLIGGMIHIAMHAFGKITLFFCAGAIAVATGKKYVSQMVGIGKQMPVTMTAFFIGALSVIGLPPTGGFISKWNLVLGTLEADQSAMLVVLLGSSLLNAAYFLPIVYRAFFCSKEESMFENSVKEAPVWCVFPLVLTAICSIVLFFYPQPFFSLAELMVQSITGR